MRINVRFFAGLRERVGISDQQLSLPEGATVAQAWSLVVDKEAIPNNVLAAKNMEYVELSCPLADGDEVAFFPPVTGGSV